MVKDLNLFVGQPFRENNSSPLLLSFILLNEDIHALLCLKYYFVSKSTAKTIGEAYSELYLKPYQAFLEKLFA